jgi:hypothetical protein
MGIDNLRLNCSKPAYVYKGAEIDKKAWDSITVSAYFQYSLNLATLISIAPTLKFVFKNS